MIRAIDDVPMSKTSHGMIDQILANVQREAQVRAAKAKMEAKPEVKQ